MLTDEERIHALVCAPIDSPIYRQALIEHDELYQSRKGLSADGEKK